MRADEQHARAGRNPEGAVVGDDDRLLLCRRDTSMTVASGTAAPDTSTTVPRISTGALDDSGQEHEQRAIGRLIRHCGHSAV